MEKDTDSFNRREMAQKLSLRVFDQLIKQYRSKQPFKVEASFLKALGTVIQDKKMDPAFKAMMLQLPPNAVLAQEQAVLDSEAFHEARKFLRTSIAAANKDALMEIYKQFHGHEAKSQNAKSFGHRMLKNQALSYLSVSEDPAILELVAKQYKDAQNMTDRITSLNILANTESPLRQQALDDFYQTWKEDTLVINKWLTAQAYSSRPSTLADVKALTKHPAFNIENPNNIYSLLRAFGDNLVRFHDPAQETYSFYADMILEIDAKNAQVAARLCSAFNFVKKLNPTLKARATKEVQRILATPTLSKNSRELLEKTMADVTVA